MGYYFLKRILDSILALIGIFLFAPFIIFISLVIFFENGRPIFYLKKSLGKQGEVFNAIKFRSMEMDSVCITRIGKLLRETAMDELPQLINIFKGDMSFVGPRTYGIENYGVSKTYSGRRVDMNSLHPCEEGFAQRLRMMPGLTGIAQVYAPKHASAKEVLNWDLQYIEKMSFLFDVYIICISIGVTFMRGWERTTTKL
jgi:lipopolysaccharide/colanic/teichoic acid biosynthesis glycosyltransferase